MQYILHIDTSTDKGIAALSANGKLIGQVINEEPRNHAAAINVMIEELLAGSNVKIGNIAAIAACAGPGSYTGLRIGVATAKGLCFAQDIPLMLHNRLTLLAYHPYIQGIEGSYIPLLFAREKEYFVAIYDSQFKCQLLPQHLTESALTEILKKNEHHYIITDLTENILQTLEMTSFPGERKAQIDLDAWAHLAFKSYECNNFTDLTFAEPFYLKQVFTHK